MTIRQVNEITVCTSISRLFRGQGCKNLPLALAIIISATVMASCGSTRNPSELTTVDLSQRFSEKELVLQDIADVEYLALETSDDFLLDNSVPRFMNDKIIVMTLFRSGDVMIFDRSTGKALSRFNRKGRSGNEYLSEFINGRLR